MQPPAPFANAPVSKSLVLLTAGTSLANLFLGSPSGAPRDMDFMSLSIFPRISKHLELWRLVTSQLAFGTPAELLFGLVLLYTLRVFERQFGSRKFAACLVTLAGLTTSLSVLFLLAFKGRFTRLSGGPYAVILGLLAYYMRDIPRVRQYRVCGVTMSDKSFTYFLFLQFIFCDPPRSLIMALFGLAAGIAYRLAPSLHAITIPASIVRFCEQHIAPLLSNRRRRGYARVGQGAPAHAAPAAAGGVDSDGDVLIPGPGAHVSAAVGPVEPDPNSVRQLMAMGFTEEDSRAALASSRNNLELATTRLLDGR